MIGGTCLAAEKCETDAFTDEIEARNSTDLLIDEGSESSRIIDSGGILVPYAFTHRKVNRAKWLRQRRDTLRDFAKIRYPDSHVDERIDHRHFGPS